MRLKNHFYTAPEKVEPKAEDIAPKIDWARPKKSKHVSTAEVIIRISRAKKSQQIAFSFEDGLAELLAPNGRMCVGFDRESQRVYFKMSNETERGYAVTAMTSSERKRVQFTVPDGWPVGYMVGCYNLESVKGYNFVDLKKKID